MTRASLAKVTGGGAPIVAGGSPPPPPVNAYSSTNLIIDGPGGFQFASAGQFAGWTAMGVNWFNTNWGSAAKCFYGCGQTSAFWGLPKSTTTLSSGLTNGTTYTALPVNATGTGTIPSGSTVYTLQGIGTNTQAWVTTAPVTLPVSTIPVTGQAANFSYASGATVVYGVGSIQATLMSRQSVGLVHTAGGLCFMGVRMDTNGAFGTGDTVMAPWWDAEWATGSGGVGTTLYAGVYNLAAAAASLGFDGIFLDSEGYTTPGDNGWEWNYSSNAHTQAATNTQAQADGQMFAQWIAAGWASAGTGTAPMILAYISAKAGFSGVVNNNGTPVTANTQGSVDEASLYAVDTVGYGSSVTTWFWSGFCAANAASGMPQSVCFITELLYRWNQQGLMGGAQATSITNWGQLLQYQANTVVAAISQLAQAFNPTGWAYWYNKVFSSGAAWIDGSGSAQDPVDSLTEVKQQLGNPGVVGAFPAWCPPSQPTAVYQFHSGPSGGQYAPTAALGANYGFDYSNGTINGGGTGSPSGFDYRPTMLNTNTAFLVNTTPPVFGTFSPASGGSHVHGATTITGSVTFPSPGASSGAYGSAIASIGYSVNGGAVQGAALTLNLLSGPTIPPTADGWDSGLWVQDMQFSAPVVLATGANSIVFTVTDIGGLQTTYGYTLTGT